MVTRDGEIIVTEFKGINRNDNALNIDDSECQEATNLVVRDGSVEIRGGFSIHSSNIYHPDDNPNGVTGGIPFLVPYYKLDGTAQLVFANNDKYYYITPEVTTWGYIGDYGTAVDNPSAYQYKNLIVFGTGKLGNKSYVYDATPKTYTANTISFENNDPNFPIKDSANGFTFDENDVITVSGSASNDGIYTVNGAGPNLVQVDEGGLVNEAAGAMITITATGFKRLLSIQAADSTGDLRFYCQFGGKDVKYLCGAGLEKDDENKNITTLFCTPNPLNWSEGQVIQVGPGDGDDITGLIQNNILVAYKESAKHYFDDFYQEDLGAFALRENGRDFSSGSANHELLLIIDGDVVTIPEKGKSIEGYGLEGTSQGNGRPKQYGTNIKPIIDNLNWQENIIRKSRGYFFDRMAFFAVPFKGSQFNNLILAGEWDSPSRNLQPSWTTWSKSIQGMTVFRDSEGVDQFYCADANLPIIYRYDPNTYSDDGSGYTRRWKSKKFSLGRQTSYDDAMHVIIEGYITLGTELFLKIYVDGKTQTYKINKNQLINASGGGGYIGDQIIGDEILGGNSGESNKFRYQAVCPIPNGLRYCKNIEVELYNSAPGQYWSMDYLSINEQINLDDLPDSSKTVEAVN